MEWWGLNYEDVKIKDQSYIQEKNQAEWRRKFKDQYEHMEKHH